MRITTQMINRSSRKSGLPGMQTSLLNQLNKTGNSAGGIFLDKIGGRNSGLFSSKVGTVQKSTYERLEKSAERLKNSADTITVDRWNIKFVTIFNIILT